MAFQNTSLEPPLPHLKEVTVVRWESAWLPAQHSTAQHSGHPCPLCHNLSRVFKQVLHLKPTGNPSCVYLRTGADVLML